jgi:putative membrane-bound dehydrogenase-like protein
MSWQVLAGVALTAVVALAAEPEIRPGQMPRIPPTEPLQAVARFKVRPGFRAELIASEPLISSPVAVAVDELGRAYVIEMRDYSERRPERLGRVRRLEDTDGDGRYDKATVFLDNLPWPTAITCWQGGVFIGATPDILYAKDTNDDGVADVREVIFTGFASAYAPYATNKLNVQALMNSFQWGPDNRIQGSASLSGGDVSLVDSPFTRHWRESWNQRYAGRFMPWKTASTNPLSLRGRDFSFDPRSLELRTESGGGQHGMSFDSQGRKFVCSNSDHLQQILLNEDAALRNPHHDLPAARLSIAADGPSAEVYRLSPDEPWRVLRTRWRVAGLVEGPIEGGGRPSGYFTGATGVTVYRGDAYGPDFIGNAFIADCGSNLVHRKRLVPGPDGIVLRGERVPDERKSEFLASADNWFRPVQLFNGPDGCLWVIDMYREIIEHPWSLPGHLKQQMDLDSGRDRGRLWRIAPEGDRHFSLKPGIKSELPDGWAEQLASANGWTADTAARLLIEWADQDRNRSIEPLLRHDSANVRRKALATLATLGVLEPEQLHRGLTDRDAGVRRNSLQIASDFPTVARTPAIVDAVRQLASDADPAVRLTWAIHAPSLLPAVDLSDVARLVLAGPPLVRSAAIHAIPGREWELLSAILKDSQSPVTKSTEEAVYEVAQTMGRAGIVESTRALVDTLTTLGPTLLTKAAAHGLAHGLVMEQHSKVVAELPHPLPAIFESAWKTATHPPTPAEGPHLAPPNPDRVAVLADYLPALDLTGDRKKGSATFLERCSRCHAVGGTGNSVGPDLASVAANSPARLLVSIIDPNREVAPNYAAWTAELKGGETLDGLLVRESTDSITVRQAGGIDRLLPRTVIQSLKSDRRSLMPEGLESGLSPQDIADLLSCLTPPH